MMFALCWGGPHHSPFFLVVMERFPGFDCRRNKCSDRFGSAELFLS
jgi:hypothetical protein